MKLHYIYISVQCLYYYVLNLLTSTFLTFLPSVCDRLLSVFIELGSRSPETKESYSYL
jgi:hypothetical protein